MILQYNLTTSLMLMLGIIVAVRLTNNVLSTAQQVYLRQLGGAQPVVDKDGGGIISAGQAKRTPLPPPASTASATATTTDTAAKDGRGTRWIIIENSSWIAFNSASLRLAVPTGT